MPAAPFPETLIIPRTPRSMRPMPQPVSAREPPPMARSAMSCPTWRQRLDRPSRWRPPSPRRCLGAAPPRLSFPRRLKLPATRRRATPARPTLPALPSPPTSPSTRASPMPCHREAWRQPASPQPDCRRSPADRRWRRLRPEQRSWRWRQARPEQRSWRWRQPRPEPHTRRWRPQVPWLWRPRRPRPRPLPYRQAPPCQPAPPPWGSGPTALR